MTSAKTFQRGDRVVSLASQRGGVVTKLGRGVSLTVRWDGGNRDERAFLDGLRHETPEDVEERARQAALAAWRARRPETRFMSVDHSFGWYGKSDELGASCRQTLKSGADMREAARELVLLADWFDARPNMD